MPGGNKRSYIIKQTCSFQLQVCLSTFDLLLPPDIKGLRIYQIEISQFSSFLMETNPCFLISLIFVGNFRVIFVISLNRCINRKWTIHKTRNKETVKEHGECRERRKCSLGFQEIYQRIPSNFIILTFRGMFKKNFGKHSKRFR